MTEYMLSVFALSCALGLCSFALYKETFEGVSKFAFSMLLLSVVLSPLSAVVSDGVFDFNFEIPEYDTDGTRDYEEVARDAFCDGIERAICEKFGFDSEEVFVSCEGFKFEKMSSELIKVTLRGRAALSDRRKSEQFVKELGIGDCEVKIEIG